MAELGTMTKHSIKDEWSKETQFTKWIGKEKNIQALAEELELDFAVSEIEVKTGKYRVDVLAQTEEGETKVVIENQYGVTDHKHLGQLMTYAAGHDARYNIWITEEADDEHRQVFDWLNENMDTEIFFFLVEAHLVKIDSSRPALRFNIISQPNNWSRLQKEMEIKNSYSELRVCYYNFWQRFREYISENTSSTHFLKSPQPQSYYNISLPRNPHAYISLNFDSRKKELRCDLIIENEIKEYFESVKTSQSSFQHITENLIFEVESQGDRERVRAVRRADVKDETNYQEYCEWLLEKAQQFYKEFNNEEV